MTQRANDSDRTHDVDTVDQYYLTYQDELQLPSEILLKYSVIHAKINLKLSNQR